MLVQCPKCKTTYKVSDALVKGAAPSFRCSRCKHTFELEAATKRPPSETHAGTVEAGPSSELAFAFDPDAGAEPESRKDSERRAESRSDVEPDSMGDAQRELKNSAANAENSTPSVIPAFPASNATPIDVTSESRSAAPNQQPKETPDNVLAIAPYREQQASITPFLTLFGLLVFGFAFAWGYQKTYPAAAERWLRAIPILGRSMTRNDYLKNGVLLKSVETKYQTLQGNREVVALSGVAVNQNPVMIRSVQLLGRLYDDQGKEIERQTMWIGNAISSQIIRGMTAQDVVDLQRLKPLKTFEIPPGDSVPFAIIFLRLGNQVKEARCEVLSALGDA